ncbi:MAG: mechanosensitive ion channel [Prevotella sp.]|nr:mechanosensitive ion channel [Prevotella sp.]
MEKIQFYVEQLVASWGLEGDTVDMIGHGVLVVIAVLLAAAVGLLCRKVLMPVLVKLTEKTEVKWDDVIFSRRVLLSACSIVPAIVIWQLLPWIFYDYPTAREVLTRLTAIYITIMSVRTLMVFIDSFKQLEGSQRTARQQYLYSFCGVMKIIIIFIAIIVVVAIAIDKDPTTLFAGLGAVSAILMLAFQDTIKGLVAGIRLTTNEMVHIGDWITVPSAGANGRVEDITLTTVKIRNFDNTIVTVTPQTLVDGSFQNWIGMEQNEGRKQVRKVYFDFRSLTVDENGVANITKFRHHIEQWLRDNPKVIAEKNPLVRQAEAAQAGCCVEFIFWLRAQAALDYEHDTSDIMEYIYASSADYGLRIYQQFPEQ